ncbi:MAG: hypothetical protein R3C14_03440 [Caldilineaceae bacterium]
MSIVGAEGRSYEPITLEDLAHLAQLAAQDRVSFFQAHPEWADAYAQRVLGVALCQGAALHYVDGVTGINDFDVYTFYRAHPQKQWYARRIKSYDFGNSKFGQSVDRPDFVGRRVDCLGRALEVEEEADVILALRHYMQEGKTETARLLAAKAVVLLAPHCGTVVWPLAGEEQTMNYLDLMHMNGEKCYTLTAEHAADMFVQDDGVRIEYESGNILFIPRTMVETAMRHLESKGVLTVNDVVVEYNFRCLTA